MLKAVGYKRIGENRHAACSIFHNRLLDKACLKPRDQRFSSGREGKFSERVLAKGRTVRAGWLPKWKEEGERIQSWTQVSCHTPELARRKWCACIFLRN